MNDWRRTATVAIYSRLPPYRAVTLGPRSHSPLPIEMPSAMIPGPVIPRSARPKRYGGGAGRSATSHSGKHPQGGLYRADAGTWSQASSSHPPVGDSKRADVGQSSDASSSQIMLNRTRAVSRGVRRPLPGPLRMAAATRWIRRACRRPESGCLTDRGNRIGTAGSPSGRTSS